MIEGVQTNPSFTVKVYRSNGMIWWNRGTEIKPNIVAFNEFKWGLLDNFNIDWIDEFSIRVNVPLGNENYLLKVEGYEGDGAVHKWVKYFYLGEIISKTKKSYECIFVLDLWCTYVLKGDFGNVDVDTVRYLGYESGSIDRQYPFFSPIVPWGIPSKNNPLNFIWNKNYPFVPEKGIPGEFWQWDGTVGTEEFRNQSSTACPANFQNLYYVFRTKDMDNKLATPSWSNYPSKGVWAIPVLFNDWNDKNKTNFFMYTGVVQEGKSYGNDYYDAFMRVINCPREINNFMSRGWNTIAHLGLGDFLGVFYGPSYWRIDREKFYNEIKIYMPKHRFLACKYSSLFSIEMNEEYLRLENSGLTENFNGVEVPEWLAPNITKKDKPLIRFEGFAAVFIPDSGVPLKPINVETFKVNGQKIYSDFNNIDLEATRMYFTDHFILTNGQQVVDLENIFPLSWDNYYNMLGAQRNTMNTSLALSGVSGLISAVNGAIPNIPVTHSYTEYDITTTKQGTHKAKEVRKPTTTKQWVDEEGVLKTQQYYSRNRFFDLPWANTTTKTGRTDHYKEWNPWGSVGKGAVGLVGAGMQFVNTLTTQEAYKKDLRVQTSSQLSNYTSNFSLISYHTNQKVFPLTFQPRNRRLERTNNMTKIDINNPCENQWGYTNDKYILQSMFYGFEDIPKRVGRLNVISGGEYVKITPQNVLTLSCIWSNVSPKIREAIITMLSNGVRVATREEAKKFETGE